MADETQLVKELREKTGAGMMDCRRALQESQWSLEKASELLRKRGTQIADKKSGRATQMGRVECYIHMTGKIGAMVEVNCETDFVARTDEFVRFVKDVAMQVTASNPKYLDRADVAPEALDKERSILRESIKDKPANIIDKIVEGKLDKFYSEQCLLEQPFIKDDKITIKDYLTQMIAKTGENIRIRRFSRFVLGE